MAAATTGAQGGEPHAGAPREVAVPRLVERYGGQLLALGRRFCGDPDEAEDLVQEVFLRAWRKWPQFEGRSSVSTWLYAIAARVCQRLHRRRSGEPERMASIEELLPLGDARMPVVPADGPLSASLRREARDRVEAAIADLPVAFRMPLVLKEIAGLSLAEIAAVLGLKEATVKTRLHRARLRLRQALEAALPARPGPPPAFARRVCLDLLRSKQEALDRGVGWTLPPGLFCERCSALFATLDLAQDACAELAGGTLPPDVERRLLERLASAGD